MRPSMPTPCRPQVSSWLCSSEPCQHPHPSLVTPPGSQAAPGWGSKLLFCEARLCTERSVLEGSRAWSPAQVWSAGQARLLRNRSWPGCLAS